MHVKRYFHGSLHSIEARWKPTTLGSQTSIWPSWDVVFHESTFKLQINSELPLLWLQGTEVA